MDLPERLLKPLISAYWVIRSLPNVSKLSSVEKELTSLNLLEVVVVGHQDGDPMLERLEVRISDKGTQLVEECCVLALIESACTSGMVYGNKIIHLIKKVPKELLPRLLASDNNIVRQVAKAWLENEID